MTGREQTGKVAIIGLGLMGGSLGLALKAAVPDLHISGYDRDGGAARKAQKMGAVDSAEGLAGPAVAGASIVVVATPILSVKEVLEEIAPHLAEGAVVTDTASTKTAVMGWAEETLPEGVSFVGGHPMAGKETAGIDRAEAGLFQGKAYCICPSLRASPDAIRSVTGLARLVGAEPLYMDSPEHDQYAAAVSHMPLMVSTALFSLVRTSPSWSDMGAMASSGFRDMTRLASGDPVMAIGMWRSNRDAIIHWLERMMSEMGRYRDMLKDAQDEQLLRVFTEAQVQRDTFIAEPPRRLPEAPLEVDKGKAFLDMLVGGKMADNLRRAEKIPEMMREAPTEKGADAGGKKRLSLADRIAEDVKRDLEKLEKNRNKEDTAGEEGH